MPDVVALSQAFTVGYLAFSTLVLLYSLWLNWKQSKVRDQMNYLLAEVKLQTRILKKIAGVPDFEETKIEEVVLNGGKEKD